MIETAIPLTAFSNPVQRSKPFFFSWMLLVFFVCVLASALFAPVAHGKAPLTVKVGAYENPPKISFDAKGAVIGFWPDLLSHIAEKENWRIVYVPGTWNEGVARLKSGEIDIMPDVAFTEKRSRLYGFSNDPILMSWTRVYIQKDNKAIETIRDLKGKKVAALKGSVNLEGAGGLREIADQFNLNCTFAELPNYTRVFEAIEEGKVDAGITNRNFGNKYAKDYHIKKTAVIFQPISMKFAFPQNAPLTPKLADRINHHINNMKEDDHSLYYGLLARYFEAEIAEKFVKVLPEWLKALILFIVLLLTVFILVSIISRIQVKRTTNELNAKNKALGKSEAEYRRLFNSIPEGIISTNDDGAIISANPACAEIMGCESPEALVGTPVINLYNDQKDRDIMLTKLNQYGYLKNHEVKIRRLDGDTRDVLCSLKIVENTNRKSSRINCIFSDISERKSLEHQLLQAQKMEAIGTLAGGIAHDFNNILMGIQGRTSLMLSGKQNDHDAHEHLLEIKGYVKDAAGLTRQLLGYARRGKFEVKPADINELVKDQNRLFGRAKKEITIKGKYGKNIRTVEIDQGQIKQALMNLYVNAWQAMADGGHIYVETQNVTIDRHYKAPFKVTPGDYVKFIVTDTGIGMDEETQKRVFDPFFTTKKMGRGTGLGLASVYGIIKNHGGFINVSSKKGTGTTFSFYLPASKKAIINPIGTKEKTVAGKGTILLVDDEDVVIDVGAQMLAHLGYEVLTAGNGKNAIEKYRKNWRTIDMVIVDMIMPDMDGGMIYDALKQINPDIIALLSSGYSIDGKATEILNRGCNGFIQKPFGLKALSQKLSRSMGPSQSVG